MAKEINCKLFIIPNAAARFNADLEYGNKSYGERVSSLASYQDRLWRFFKDLNFEKDDRMVEVWIHSGKEYDENSNWNDHPGEFAKAVGLNTKEEEYKRYTYIPKYLPSHIFMGKKEGDKIQLHTHYDEVVLNITLQQSGYRYGSFGKFEDVFHMLRCDE